MDKTNKSSNFMKTVSKKRMFSLFILLVILIVAGLLLYIKYFKKAEVYTIVNGYVEKVTESQGLILKEEQVVDVKNENAIIPLIEQGTRVRKTESIAIYKDEKYQEYINKINDLDKQIETLIKDLPDVYTNDISYIESQIEYISKQARKTSSYIKMQEYKKKADELSNKKVKLLGELSPKGSKVRELIENRTKIEDSYINSSDNVKANISGCVTYKLDGLENMVDLSKVLSFHKNDFDDLFSKYGENLSNDFGIKIVNNFISYIAIKTPFNEYMKEGNVYTISFSDKTEIKENVTLIKIIDIDENNKYCIFKLSNGIENLIDSRIENIEITWTKKSGLAIPLSSINIINDSNIGEVTIIKNGDYLNVPLKIVLSNDNMAIVDNLTDEERIKNNIDNTSKIEIFDQVIIKE